MVKKPFSADYFPFLDLGILQSRVIWSIRLRWIAVSGYFIATLIALYQYNLNLPYEKIWLVLGALLGLNIIYFAINKIYKSITFRAELFILQIHIVLDLLALTLLVHYSGGVENPIYFFYVFHVVMSSIVFPGFSPLVIGTMVVLLFGTLIYLEYTGIVYHYCLFEAGIHSNGIFITLVLAVFTITVYVSIYICMTFMYLYREIKRQIDHKNKQLQETDLKKTEFYRYTSHELKSPVVAIKSTIDGVLKNFELNEKAAGLLGRAARRTQQMLDIIRELLELSKSEPLDSGQNMEEVDIGAIILEGVEQVTDEAESRQLDICHNVKPGLFLTMGRRNELKEVFLNLLSNAVRYSEAGKIEVSASQENEHFRFIFKDEGIGISGEDQERIFDEFYRSENARKKVNYGTGLGLSLVKKIIENYGGTISLESELNKGSTFTIIIPKLKHHNLKGFRS